MTRRCKSVVGATCLAGLLLGGPAALAQAQGAGQAAAGSQAGAAGGQSVVNGAGAAAVGNGASYGGVAVPYAGTPLGFPAAGPDPDAHLNSGSRARINPDEGDQFDLAASHAGGNLVHGNAGAGMAQGPGGGGGSGLYVVKPGDTLSKISETVYGQPWMWAKLWGQNPQIQNPHWIYPGDQVRLGPDSGSRLRASGASLTLGGGSHAAAAKAKPGSAIFIGEKGYLDDPAAGIAGEIVGATLPVQLMSQGDEIYISIRPGQQLAAGQVVQIFREVRDAPKVDGARTPPGKVVAIKGAVRLDYVQAEKRIARGVIVESRDIIERGDHVADVPLSFWVVPARPSSKNTVARLLTSMRPSIFLGQQDVVFIDRGSEDGLVAGNRLFVVRRGDTWRRTLETASVQAQTRVEMDNGDGLHFEVTTPRGNEQDFPEEIVGELRIIKTQRFSSYALVTASRSELVPGDRAVARAGY